MPKHRRMINPYAILGITCVGAAALYLAVSGFHICPPPAGQPLPESAENPVARPTVGTAAPAPQASVPLPERPVLPEPPARAPAPAAPAPAAEADAMPVAGSPPPPGKYSAVGLAAVADAAAQTRFAVSLASQRCYAERHGYEYHVINPRDHPSCTQRDFFFKKHCSVARFLERQREDYLLFVLDGDNPAVVLDRNLDTWLAEAQATDVVLYERWMNNEIMAGNYIVRSSPWGIAFCDGWASYDQIDQPSGFHSSDNGAIHLHVLRSLRISHWGHCAHLWEELTSSVMDLDPYYGFVACTRLLMGPPRRWKVEGEHRLTILPRGHAWSIDGVVVGSKTASVGAVTHHGQKTAQNYLQYFTPAFVRGPEHSCSVMLRGDISTDAATYMRILAHSLEERVEGGFQSWTRQAPPPWDFAYRECMRTLSCRPVDDGAELRMSLPRPGQRALPFQRVPRDAKFVKCAKEHDRCACNGLVRFGLQTPSYFGSQGQSKLTVALRVQGSVTCNNQAFGGHDPAPGDAKLCFCASDA